MIVASCLYFKPVNIEKHKQKCVPHYWFSRCSSRFMRYITNPFLSHLMPSYLSCTAKSSKLIKSHINIFITHISSQKNRFVNVWNNFQAAFLVIWGVRSPWGPIFNFGEREIPWLTETSLSAGFSLLDISEAFDGWFLWELGLLPLVSIVSKQDNHRLLKSLLWRKSR